MLLLNSLPFNRIFIILINTNNDSIRLHAILWLSYLIILSSILAGKRSSFCLSREFKATVQQIDVSKLIHV